MFSMDTWHRHIGVFQAQQLTLHDKKIMSAMHKCPHCNSKNSELQNWNIKKISYSFWRVRNQYKFGRIQKKITKMWYCGNGWQTRAALINTILVEKSCFNKHCDWFRQVDYKFSRALSLLHSRAKPASHRWNC